MVCLKTASHGTSTIQTVSRTLTLGSVRKRLFLNVSCARPGHGRVRRSSSHHGMYSSIKTCCSWHVERSKFISHFPSVPMTEQSACTASGNSASDAMAATSENISTGALQGIIRADSAFEQLPCSGQFLLGSFASQSSPPVNALGPRCSFWCQADTSRTTSHPW